MGKIPSTKRRNQLPSRPYFTWRTEETHAALSSELVGFEVGDTRQRLWDWLAHQGFGTRMHSPSLGRYIVTDVKVPKQTPGEQPLVTKARAVLSELQGSLTSLEYLYGRERLAGKRWHRALAHLLEALAELRSVRCDPGAGGRLLCISREQR